MASYPNVAVFTSSQTWYRVPRFRSASGHPYRTWRHDARRQAAMPRILPQHKHRATRRNLYPNLTGASGVRIACANSPPTGTATVVAAAKYPHPERRAASLSSTDHIPLDSSPSSLHTRLVARPSRETARRSPRRSQASSLTAVWPSGSTRRCCRRSGRRQKPHQGSRPEYAGSRVASCSCSQRYACGI